MTRAESDETDNELRHKSMGGVVSENAKADQVRTREGMLPQEAESVRAKRERRESAESMAARIPRQRSAADSTSKCAEFGEAAGSRNSGGGANAASTMSQAVRCLTARYPALKCEESKCLEKDVWTTTASVTRQPPNKCMLLESATIIASARVGRHERNGASRVLGAEMAAWQAS